MIGDVGLVMAMALVEEKVSVVVTELVAAKVSA